MKLLLQYIGSYAAAILLGYIGFTTVAAAAVAVKQERKIWQSKALPSLSIMGQLKVFVFNIVWMMCCLIGSILISLKWVFMFGRSDIESEGNRWVEDTAARIVVRCLVGDVRVVGRENLPPLGIIPAPVYIANHSSQADAGAVYFLDRRFKWVAKKSVLYLPGVGQVMWLSQHVLIDRRKGKNGKSVSNLFEKSDAAIQSGLPMFFFPQGTRQIAERLPAKDGAFIVAQNNCSALVPVSIDIPVTAWNSTYPLSLLWGGGRPLVTLTVHKPISTDGNDDREVLKHKCMQQIYSVLPKYENTKDL